ADNVTRLTRTEYQYDGQTFTQRYDVVQHDYAFDPFSGSYNTATDYRGNVTQTTTYTDGTNLTGPISETYRYDIAGNLVTTSTSCCEQTTNVFTVNTQYAYPESKIRGSSSDPFKQVKVSATFDFNTGLILSTTDANGRTASTAFSATTLRPTVETSPTGAHTDTSYDDVAMTVTSTTYLAASEGGGIANQSV